MSPVPAPVVVKKGKPVRKHWREVFARSSAAGLLPPTCSVSASIQQETRYHLTMLVLWEKTHFPDTKSKEKSGKNSKLERVHSAHWMLYLNALPESWHQGPGCACPPVLTFKKDWGEQPVLPLLVRIVGMEGPRTAGGGEGSGWCERPQKSNQWDEGKSHPGFGHWLPLPSCCHHFDVGPASTSNSAYPKRTPACPSISCPASSPHSLPVQQCWPSRCSGQEPWSHSWFSCAFHISHPVFQEIPEAFQLKIYPDPSVLPPAL